MNKEKWKPKDNCPYIPQSERCEGYHKGIEAERLRTKKIVCDFEKAEIPIYKGAKVYIGFYSNHKKLIADWFRNQLDKIEPEKKSLTTCNPAGLQGERIPEKKEGD